MASAGRRVEDMRRIAMMVLRLFLKAPYYLFCIWRCGRREVGLEEAYACVKKVTKAANRAGRVTIEAHGLENIPQEKGFIFFPNHQGLFDVLVFLESCPVPFSFVIKKEASKVILLKQVVAALRSIIIDREDVRQSMQVNNQMAEEVKKGRNFLSGGNQKQGGEPPAALQRGNLQKRPEGQVPHRALRPYRLLQAL